jgi:hypothetical protein
MVCVHMTHDIHWFGISFFILEVRSEAVSFLNSDEVLFSYPLLAFLRVPCISPSLELKKGDMIAGVECLRAYHPTVVETPPSDDGIEVTDDSLLWSVSLLPQHLPDLLRVTFDGFLAGFDEGFEAQWLSMRAFSSVGFSHRKLTDGVAKKVKAYASFIGCERMGDFCFVWTQPESHAFEPFGHERCCFL